MSKREKMAIGLFIFGVLWYFGENVYFGWHAKPQSAIEGVADFMIWIFWGLAYFIRPTRVEKTIYKVEKGTFNMLGETNLNGKE